MSLAVLGYQALIFAIIVVAASLSGRKACLIAAGLASVWTITHIFMPWLMGLQFVTIVIATSTGLSIASNKDDGRNEKAEIEQGQTSSESRSHVGWLTFAIVALVVIALYSTNRSGDGPQKSKVATEQSGARKSPSRNSSKLSNQRLERDDWGELPPDRKLEGDKQPRVITDVATTKEVQILLIKLGHYDGPIDGKFGPKTRGAISQFQREIGVYPDGTISPSLVDRLRAQ